MLTLRRILVPTDFSESAALARAEALRIARRAGAEVHVLHVAQGREMDMLLQDAASDHDAHKLYVYVSEWLGLPAAPPQGGAPEEEATLVRALRHAPSAARGITDYANEHDIGLVVMGTHGRTGVRRWVLGSVAEEVVRRAACPVLTIRAGDVRPSEAGPKRILVPVDFSEPTRSLIGHARAMAALNKVQVDLLYVIQEPNALRLFKVDGFRALLPEVARRSRAMLKDMAEESGGPYVPVRCHVLTGDPAREIVRFAEAQGHDGILMGTHGRSGLRRLAMGSVAERVMRTAPCPVFALKVFGESLVGISEEAQEQAAAPEQPRTERPPHRTRSAAREPAK